MYSILNPSLTKDFSNSTLPVLHHLALVRSIMERACTKALVVSYSSVFPHVAEIGVVAVTKTCVRQ